MPGERTAGIAVPRGQLHEIAERYDNAYSLPSDPPVEWVRQVASENRMNSDYADSEAERNALLGEALALDALADRREQEVWHDGSA